MTCGALRREVDHQFVVAVIPIGEHAAAFEMHRRLPVHAELAAAAAPAPIASDAGSPSVTLLRDEGVVGPVIEQLRRCRPASRRRQSIDRRQRLDLDLDPFGEIFGMRADRPMQAAIGWPT